MSRRYRWLCGLDDSECTGALIKIGGTGGIYADTRKVHGSPDQAFKCYVAYLKREKYKQIGPREFSPPDDGPVLVLTKKTRFGGRLRTGKEGRMMHDIPQGNSTIY